MRVSLPALCISLALAGCSGSDGSGGGGPIVSAPTPTPTPTPVPTPTPTPTISPRPTSTDRVLGDLLMVGRWAGDWQTGKTYAVGDLVRDGGKYWFAFAAGLSVATPATSLAQFRELPLVTDEIVYYNETFADPGKAGTSEPLDGRVAANGLVWHTTGPAAASARISYSPSGDNGTINADGQAYFVVSGFTKPITQASIWTFFTPLGRPYGEDVATMAFSPLGFPDFFSSMWHVDFNGRDSGLGTVTKLTDAGMTAVDPPALFKWSSTTAYGVRPYGNRVFVRPRGAFMFAYTNDLLTSIILSDKVAMATNANSIAIGHHKYASAGEYFYRIEVYTKP